MTAKQWTGQPLIWTVPICFVIKIYDPIRVIRVLIRVIPSSVHHHPPTVDNSCNLPAGRQVRALIRVITSITEQLRIASEMNHSTFLQQPKAVS